MRYIFIFLAGILVTTPALAADYMPDGYQYFCRHNATLCADQDGPVATAEQVAAVNRAVNHWITFADDRPIVVGWTQPPAGRKPDPLLVTDTWSVEPKRGDCEDYAATKMARLLGQGVGRDHLRLALTKVHGVGHIVLLVETERGWLLLDNRSTSTAPERYRILAIEAPGRAWKAQ